MPELDDSDRTLLKAAASLPAIGPFASFGRRWYIRCEPSLSTLLLDLYGDLLCPDAERSDAAGAASAADDGGETTAIFHIVVAGESGGWLVTRNRERIGRGRKAANAMGSLVWAINRWVLDHASREHLLLHAGGVTRDDGVAALLPAPSESGKSTLTTGLLDRGFQYLSDEAVSITNDGRVGGYAKPLSIDRGAWEILEHHRPDVPAELAVHLSKQWHVRASSFAKVRQSATVGVVIFPRYQASTRTSLTKSSPSTKVLLAALSTFAPGNGRHLEREQIEMLARTLSGAPAFSLTYADLGEACEAVAQLLAEAPSIIDRPPNDAWSSAG